MHSTIWDTEKFEGLAKTHFVYGGVSESVASGTEKVVSPIIDLSKVSAIIFDIYNVGITRDVGLTDRPDVRLHFGGTSDYIGITSNSVGTRVISTVGGVANISTSLAGNVWPVVSTDIGFMRDMTTNKLIGHMGYSMSGSDASAPLISTMRVVLTSSVASTLTFTSCVTTIIHKTSGADIVRMM